MQTFNQTNSAFYSLRDSENKYQLSD